MCTWAFFSLKLIVRLLVSFRRSYHNLYIYTFGNTDYQSHSKGTLNAVCQVCQYKMLLSRLPWFFPPPHICRHVVPHSVHYEAVCFYNLNIYISLNIVGLFVHMDNAILSHYFHLTRRTPVTLISCVGHSGKPLRSRQLFIDLCITYPSNENIVRINTSN